MRQRGKQVPQKSGFVSCCAVVHNCMRNIFVVPKPDIFVGPRLEELENGLTADPATKKDLICHLHVSLTSQLILRDCSNSTM
jgi:hypothetical protein